ncbi:MAG: copper resistance protein NlpE [Ignavibacteria bacterium]|jgi:hypothetical protein|nr:copper resistance protein NlpE [Ignavibacteria bacterium]MCU7501885.1 copper resistance protein NlpE [Ignavibacteria bacterium]MCU7514769.1 copper resistance protein NlpE [Ignavibacteria bacterium]
MKAAEIKNIILSKALLLLLFLPALLSAQERVPGEYEACFNSVLQDSAMGDTCLNIQLNDDNSYSLQVKYPSEIRTENGSWRLEGNTFLLTPYNSSDYYDLYDTLLDSLLKERRLEVNGENLLLWRFRNGRAVFLKKVRKCNC